MIIRIRFRKQGGHVHCRLFTSPASILTFAKCGDIVFDEREWPEVATKLRSIAEVIDDESESDFNPR